MSVVKASVAISTACACGAVGLRIEGRVKSMFMCSCRDCKRATGSGHSAVVAFATDDVTITGPAQGFDRAAASGATMTRWFCPTCGTPLSARSSRAPALTLVPVGLLGEIDWYVPSQLIFARSHEDWDVVAPELPRYATYRGEPDAEALPR